jgi:hypothetical protein
MKLPVALKNQMEESERKFQGVLDRLGLSREELGRVAEKAEKLRPARTVPARQKHVIEQKGRIYHV